ncbi:MAG: glycosyltransferase [Acidimicrobiales bacterium]
MAWHVLSSTYFDFERFDRESKADTLPHHLLPKIADRLGAEIHQPEQAMGSLLDRIGSVLYSEPEHWAQARRVYPLLEDGDSVYTAGCDAGIPLALICAVRRRPVSFAIAFADPTRLRPKLVGWLLVLLSLKLTVIVTTDHQERLVKRSFGRHVHSVRATEGQTDCKFFRPGDERRENDPPLVASCGVEQRDYRTMATALADVDVEAKVCFVSPNRTTKTRYTLPDPVPANFEFRHFEFLELRELYQQADIVVVPLIENRYSAGLTTLFEAIACGTPIVVTESPGIVQGLIEEGLILGVPPGDEVAMKAAVEGILADRPVATRRAEAARAAIMERYSAGSYLDLLESILTGQPHPVTPI